MDNLPSLHRHTGIDSPKIDYKDLMNTPVLSVDSLMLNTLVAGETLSPGDIVCIKPGYTDYYPSDDAYVDQANATTNYYNSTNLYMGTQLSTFAYLSFLKWDTSTWPSPEKILQADFGIYESAASGSPITATINRVTSSWAENTITYNTRPSTTNDLPTAYGTGNTFVTGSTGIITSPVTQIARQWKAGAVSNYGVSISGGGAAGDYVTFNSKENGGQKPFIRIYSYDRSDGKAYKAKASDFLLSANVIGVISVGAVSGGAVTVRSIGTSPELMPGGNFAPVYLAENGGVQFDTQGLSRIIKIAKPLTSASSIMDITAYDMKIEAYNAYSSNYVVYTPSDFRKVVILGTANTGYAGLSANFAQTLNKLDGSPQKFATTSGSTSTVMVDFYSDRIVITPPTGATITNIILLN